MANDEHGRIIHGNCRDCPHWDHLEAPKEVAAVMPNLGPGRCGVCRKSSPLHIQDLDPAKVPDTLISGIRPGYWPITRGSDWCGEHPLRAAYASLQVEEFRIQVKVSARQAARASRANRGQGGK